MSISPMQALRKLFPESPTGLLKSCLGAARGHDAVETGQVPMTEMAVLTVMDRTGGRARLGGERSLIDVAKELEAKVGHSFARSRIFAELVWVLLDHLEMRVVKDGTPIADVVLNIPWAMESVEVVLRRLKDLGVTQERSSVQEAEERRAEAKREQVCRALVACALARAIPFR